MNNNLITKLSLLLFLLNLSIFNIQAQESAEEDFIFKPSFGIGSGMFTYYGDISKGKSDNGATISRMALDLRVTQPINRYLDASFYFLKGRVAANERSLTRNLNFESRISVWGLQASYNFDHFLDKDRYVEPFICVGIESVEFLSKTDLKDANGNAYYYWSDGTIRSDDEYHPEGSPANIKRLARDFTYESDIRELNIDSFGKYPERTYAIPLGIGFNMLLNEQLSFRLSTTYHMTFTDFLDGVTEQSKGNRKGNAANDRLLYTSFSINYNINNKIGSSLLRPALQEGDIMALDEDGDGVMDFDDFCPGTPSLVPVDVKGCPLDKDGDGIADYLDQELDSPDSLLVDSNGNSLTDEQLEMMAAMRNDSMGRFGKGGGETNVVRRMHYSDGADLGDAGDRYMVRIGEFTGGLPADAAEELLSMPDVNTFEENGVTYITVGNFNNIPDAMKRKLQLTQEGFDVAEVVKSDSKGKLNKVDNIEDVEIPATTSLGDPKDQTIFRVQIGAFRNKIAKKVFRDVPAVVMLPFEDGINRYMTGSYKNFEEAAKTKVDLISKGYPGAFVVAFQNGKRISLKEAGVVMLPEGKNNRAAVNTPSAIDKKLVRFSVEIGVYKSAPTPEDKAVLDQLEGVFTERTDEGLIRYMAGDFNSIEQAEAYQKELVVKGLKEAATIGRFKNATITAQEAIELLK